MERIWTKSFTLITVGTFFLFIAFYMLYPTLPVFITEIGGTEADAGLAMGAFMLTAVLVRPFVGGLLDRAGRRPFVVAGVLLFALAMYLYTWAGGIVVLIGLRILHGISWAISTTAIQTAVTDLIPTTRRGEGLGWYGMAMTVAMAVGPLLGLAVVQNLSYHALFFCAVGLSLAALGAMLGAHIPFRPHTGARRIEIFEPSVLPVTASVFFLFVAYGGITTFVPLFTSTIGVNSGLFFLAYAATLFVIRPVAGRLSDWRGETFILVPALVVAVVALLSLSVAGGLRGVILAAVLYGIGFGSAMPVLQATTIRLARPDRIGVANASFSTAADLGIGLGAIVLGWVSQYSSYQSVFVVGAVSVALSLLIFALVVQRVLKRAAHVSVSNDTIAQTR
jgi:MFS family permease